MMELCRVSMLDCGAVIANYGRMVFEVLRAQTLELPPSKGSVSVDGES
jgi:hypothetical protein